MVCNWKYWHADDYPYYETECDNAFTYEGSDKDMIADGFRYCPYCGRLIVIVRHVYGWEEDEAELSVASNDGAEGEPSQK